MSILPAVPSKYVYNDPAFYTQILPPEYIGNRRAELMYGEMRLARFMYVFREHMKYWLAPESGIRDDSNLYMEFDLDAKFLSLWFCIDDRRKLAWPSMVELVTRYVEEVYGSYQYGRDEWRFPDMVAWIDAYDGTVWQKLIVDRYDRLVAGANYKDL